MRIFLGKIYFTLKRHAAWQSGSYRFGRIQPNPLSHTVFTHSTPMLRKLKNVDMAMQYNKITNLKIACEKISGVVLYPGETFSYWRMIGKPSKRKGYQNGMVLHNGTFHAGVGGGLCQLSNLIYWITLHTPLTVVERHRHSYDVFPDSNRTQPFASGATCFYNYIDLMIRNDTEEAFQLVLDVGSSDLQGAWKTPEPVMYQYEVYEKNHSMQLEYWGGYSRHNALFRKKYDQDGNTIEDEFIVENHAYMMYSPLIDAGAVSKP